MKPGMYKVKLRVVDATAYSSHHGKDPSFKTKTVERWFNTSEEKDDLFRRWALQGVSAKLGRFVGR